MVHPVPNPTGKRTRMSFARIKEVANMPNLIEIQLDSYNWFLKEGLDEVFDDIAAITNYGGNLSLRFVGFHLDRDNVKYSIEECKERDATYAAPLKVTVRLENTETGEIKYAGDGNLLNACEKALKQVEETKYEETLLENGVEKILKYGIACYMKHCKVMCSER